MSQQAIPSGTAGQIRHLPLDVAQLQETIRLLEDERQRVIEGRRRRLLIMGAGLSLVFHLGLMVYLSMVQRGGGYGFGNGSGGGYTVAIVNQDELTQPEEMTFDELPAGPAMNDEAAPDPASLDATSSDSTVATASAGAIPTLGASGDGSGGIPGVGNGGGSGGDGLGLGGGGGSASFFGLGGKGQRFAYIVDISGSMGNDRKLEIAMKELAHSIDNLPDFAYFYILLFESKTIQPPMQTGWMRARKSSVRQVIRWLSDVDPNGGTEPRNAFLQVFALDVRPDVIFFLTDGIFNDISLEELNALNAKGKKVVMNTVGFGTPGEVDQSILRSIASQSGGQYRFVSTGGKP